MNQGPTNQRATREIQLSIDSNLQDVALVGVSVRALCLHFSLAQDVAYQVELCVVEMINNVIEHGYRFETGNPIRIEMKFEEGRVGVTLVDHAEPIESCDHQAPQFDPEDLESLPENGYGRFLVDQIMDRVDYHRENDRNYLYMEKSFVPERRAG
ncbi:ATP-binding protein [Sulfidibacter corallicola]|uniref:ATP-binding protein n=1 Tax=Sulfidibacter corallicola TaxID=2818388 RepID=A0A8A4TNA2_SULCO|nr:ATP-binding protein [Sulfidibacter corallicola]QTD51446.1 ATP-binding protein [Sulfidibacter corallicola]